MEMSILKRLIVGAPMPLAQARHERLSKTVALAVFSSDAMSSVAYATEEILLILVLAGTAAAHLTVPIALAIAGLLVVVSVSYQQTIHAYPSGGGSYIVARANLGPTAGLVAAGALLIDYVLTVSVSVAAGVAALTSAVPWLLTHRVLLGVVFTGAIAYANLRGVRESGRVFAVPTYLFIVTFSVLVGTGLFRWLTGTLPAAAAASETVAATQTLTWFLVLPAYTSFADFPRLNSLLARDRYAPRQFRTLGDRLVFSNGILILAGLAAALIIVFGGDTHALIPLYAVGVFISFTLSQAGMVRHWLTDGGAGWRWRLGVNGVGALVTGAVTVVIAVTKFTHGAWIVVLLIPLLVLGFRSIYRHYDTVAHELSLEHLVEEPPVNNTVLVLVGDLHMGVVKALRYAQSLSPSPKAVYVELDPSVTARLEERWSKGGCGVPLVVLASPYRSMLRPLLDYIGRIRERDTNSVVTIVIPEFVPRQWWQHLLHNQTALLVKGALLFRRGVVVVDVPFHLHS